MAGREWMLLGRVSGPFGVRGEIKVELFTDFPDRFLSLDHGYFGPARMRLSIESGRRHKGQVLLKVEGFDSREEVERLRGQEIYVPREEAISLPEGHYYLDDLLGIAVVTSGGECKGRVTDVLRTGSNDVLVVNKGRDEILIPVTKEAVPVLDLEAQRAVVEDWIFHIED